MDIQKKRTFIINFLYYMLLVGLVYVFFEYCFGLVSPFIFAFIISAMLRKPINKISSSINISKKVVSIIVVLIFYGTIGVLVGVAGVKLFSMSASFFESLPEIYNDTIAEPLDNFLHMAGKFFYGMDEKLVITLDNFFSDFISSLGSVISNLSVSLLSMLSSKATSLPLFFAKMLIMIISTFFISIDYDEIKVFIKRQFPKKWQEVIVEVKTYVKETVIMCIKSYGKIILITFVELSVGFMVLGVNGGIKIALITSLLDILPVLGTGGVLIPWAIVMFVQSQYTTAIGLIVIYVVVIVVRNIVEPKIVGEQMGLHPALTIISMFIGVQVFGFFGLITAPIFTALVIHLNKKGIINLYK